LFAPEHAPFLVQPLGSSNQSSANIYLSRLYFLSSHSQPESKTFIHVIYFQTSWKGSMAQYSLMGKQAAVRLIR
jgi:hypothetical protein